MNKYQTSNYDIVYKQYNYKIDTTVETELLRKYYYELLLNYFIELVDINSINDKKKKEIFFYFIVNNNDNDKIKTDPIIDKYKFDHNFIKNIIKNNIGEKYDEYSELIKDSLKKVNDRLSEYMREYIKIVKKCKPCFTVNINKQKDDLIIVSATKTCDDDFYLDISKLYFSIHISLYKHLYKLFMVRNKKTEQNTDWIPVFHEKVFILYCRYNYISSGSTQASILPQLKRKLKDLLNTKIELFASAINSSYMNYGSLFYDIEQYFGSLGNYFSMNIKSGYYEANPPFEYDLIQKMFTKMLKELTIAEKNKKGLLFFIVIPRMDLSAMQLGQSFLKYKKLINKSDMPYVYYDASFSYAITRNIIDTYIIIYHNSYIKDAVKRNVEKFNII